MSLSSSSSSSLFCPQLKASFKAIIVELNEQITQRQPVDQASYLKRVQELIGQQRMQAALTFAQLKPYLSAAASMPEVKVDQSKMHGINMIIAHIQKGLANDTAYQYLRQLCGSEVWDSVRHQVLMQQGMVMQQGSGSSAGGGESGASGEAPANTLPSQTQTLAHQQPLAAQTQAQDQQAQDQQKHRLRPEKAIEGGPPGVSASQQAVKCSSATMMLPSHEMTFDGAAFDVDHISDFRLVNKPQLKAILSTLGELKGQDLDNTLTQDRWAMVRTVKYLVLEERFGSAGAALLTATPPTGKVWALSQPLSILSN